MMVLGLKVEQVKIQPTRGSHLALNKWLFKLVVITPCTHAQAGFKCAGHRRSGSYSKSGHLHSCLSNQWPIVDVSIMRLSAS